MVGLRLGIVVVVVVVVSTLIVLLFLGFNLNMLLLNILFYVMACM